MSLFIYEFRMAKRTILQHFVSWMDSKVTILLYLGKNKNQKYWLNIIGVNSLSSKQKKILSVGREKSSSPFVPRCLFKSCSWRWNYLFLTEKLIFNCKMNLELMRNIFFWNPYSRLTNLSHMNFNSTINRFWSKPLYIHGFVRNVTTCVMVGAPGLENIPTIAPGCFLFYVLR